MHVHVHYLLPLQSRNTAPIAVDRTEPPTLWFTHRCASTTQLCAIM